MMKLIIGPIIKNENEQMTKYIRKERMMSVKHMWNFFLKLLFWLHQNKNEAYYIMVYLLSSHLGVSTFQVHVHVCQI